jgi:hypothetical protein
MRAGSESLDVVEMLPPPAAPLVPPVALLSFDLALLPPAEQALAAASNNTEARAGRLNGRTLATTPRNPSG